MCDRQSLAVPYPWCMTNTYPSFQIRAARASDGAAIANLVGRKRGNANSIHWQRFTVAQIDEEVAGAVEVRLHRDGSRELGSFVVHPDWRGHGIGSELIVDALARQRTLEPLYLVSETRMETYFGQLGFLTIPSTVAPPCLQRRLRLGILAGRFHSLWRGRRPARLVIMEMRGEVLRRTVQSYGQDEPGRWIGSHDPLPVSSTHEARDTTAPG